MYIHVHRYNHSFFGESPLGIYRPSNSHKCTGVNGEALLVHVCAVDIKKKNTTNHM